jgi:DNA repair exonuclease SbcCD ATPase subunit
MSTSKEQWKIAFDLLSKFERDLISPKEFKWQYFIDNVGASKPTLWRNEEFKMEFQRVQKLVKQYKTKNIEYSLERSKLSIKDQEIENLKARIKKLENERDRERERLAYAAMVARRHNIDPEQFNEKSPLLKANEKKTEKSIIDMNDPVIAVLRKKKR